MSTRKQRECAKCGEPIPIKNKQDRCDACIGQVADGVEVGAKVGAALLPVAIGIIKLVLKLMKRK